MKENSDDEHEDGTERPSGRTGRTYGTWPRGRLVTGQGPNRTKRPPTRRG